MDKGQNKAADFRAQSAASFLTVIVKGAHNAPRSVVSGLVHSIGLTANRKMVIRQMTCHCCPTISRFVQADVHIKCSDAPPVLIKGSG